MPTNQNQRNLIAKMKLIPVRALIKDKKLLLIDDSIVRGTQLRETTEFLYRSGAKEVHVRPACPPIMYGCKYLNFSRSKSELDLITRRIIEEREEEVTPEILHTRGLIKKAKHDLVILGTGELTKALKISAHRFTKTAKEKIEALGGKAEVK